MSISTKMVGVVVCGTAQAQRDLDRRRRQFGRNWERGMLRGGAFLLDQANRIVPVDQGPLRASGFVRHSGKGLRVIVRVGYTADYAMMVHEDLDAAHGEAFNRKYAHEITIGAKQPWNNKTFHTRGAGQSAKFLEIPARRDRGRIVQIVRESASRRIG